MAARDDFADFFGDDDTPVIDTRADGRLYRVPLGRLAPNLVNPRTDFGTEDELIDFGKSLARRQNQPCPVVSRAAYLKLWPDHADQIGDVDYVLVSGERRYRAATAVGLPALDCVVNDDFAQDRKTFMESVVSENVDRQNFDPIEEAYAVQALVREFGSNRAVAQHFERVDGWVTQRLLLTHLADDVKLLVREKSMPLEVARALGKLARDNNWGTDDQLAWWEAEQERRAAAAAARAAARKAAKQQSPSVPPRPAVAETQSEPAAASAPQSFTAVKPDPAPDSQPKPAAVAEPRPQTPKPTAVGPEAERAAEPVDPERDRQSGPQATSLPEQRGEDSEAGPDGQQPPKLPYDDPRFIARHLATKMTDRDFFTLVELVTWTANDRDPEWLRSVLAKVLGDSTANAS